MIRSSFAAVTSLLIASICGPVYAQGPPEPPPLGGPPHRPPFHHVLEHHAERLGLEESVRAEITAIAESSRAKLDTQRERLRAAHEALRGLLEREHPTEEAVMHQAERIGQLETENHKHRLRTVLRIRALLTPEQRRELIAIQQEMKRDGGPPRRKGKRPRRYGPP